MKNMKHMLAALLGAMVLVLSACSSSGGNTYADAGKYVLDSMTVEGETITADDLALFGMTPDDMYIELNDDGSATMVLFDETEELTWTDGKITDADGEVLKYTVKDGIMEITEGDDSLTFKLAS